MIHCPGEPDPRAQMADLPTPVEPYELTEDDLVLFNHPKLRYIRLSSLNFGAFDKTQAPKNQYKELSILCIDNTKYTSQAFQNLVMSSASLKKMTLLANHWLPLSYATYAPLLARSAATLTDLKLCWMGGHFDPKIEDAVLDFRKFTALRLLAIDLRYVLGSKSLPADADDQGARDAAQSIARRLPPNIETLVLEGLVIPYPPPFQTADTEMPLIEVLRYTLLIRLLVEEKKALYPKLEQLFVDCGHGESEIPEWLCEIGDKFEVDLGWVNMFEFCDEEDHAMALID